MKGIDQDNLVHWRYSRRLGEQVPDAAYANPFDLPEPRLRISGRAACVLIALALSIIIIGVLS